MIYFFAKIHQFQLENATNVTKHNVVIILQ